MCVPLCYVYRNCFVVVNSCLLSHLLLSILTFANSQSSVLNKEIHFPFTCVFVCVYVHICVLVCVVQLTIANICIWICVAYESF